MGNGKLVTILEQQQNTGMHDDAIHIITIGWRKIWD